jgi:hypothetical protein
MTSEPRSVADGPDYDVIIVGAGFAGLNALYRFRARSCRAPSSRALGPSAAPGTGTAIRAPGSTSRAWSIPTRSRRSSHRNGSGRSGTPSNRTSSLDAGSGGPDPHRLPRPGRPPLAGVLAGRRGHPPRADDVRLPRISSSSTASRVRAPCSPRRGWATTRSPTSCA